MLQPRHDGIAYSYLGPSAPINVKTQDATDLALDGVGVGVAVNGPADRACSVLCQADSDRLPIAIGEEGQVEVPLHYAALRRTLMPGADEVGALLEGVVPQRLDLERLSGCFCAHSGSMRANCCHLLSISLRRCAPTAFCHFYCCSRPAAASAHQDWGLGWRCRGGPSIATSMLYRSPVCPCVPSRVRTVGSSSSRAGVPTSPALPSPSSTRSSRPQRGRRSRARWESWRRRFPPKAGAAPAACVNGFSSTRPVGAVAARLRRTYGSCKMPCSPTGAFVFTTAAPKPR